MPLPTQVRIRSHPSRTVLLLSDSSSIVRTVIRDDHDLKTIGRIVQLVQAS